MPEAPALKWGLDFLSAFAYTGQINEVDQIMITNGAKSVLFKLTAVEGYIRFVFAKPMEEIKEGMDRVEKAIHELN